MDTQKAIELIEKSEHMALVLPPAAFGEPRSGREADLDLLASAEVMAETLEAKGKTVGFLPDKLILPEKIFGSPLFSKINNPDVLPKEFIVSVDISRSPVSQLRYEKSGAFMHIILSPQFSSIKKEYISFLDGKIKCDSVITLGAQSIETLNGAAGTGPEFFSETPLINIDNNENNKNFGEANLVNSRVVSLSEIMYEFITTFRGEPITSGQATLLLAGILHKTDSLSSAQTLADTLLSSSELMRLGANRNAAQALIPESVPLALLQLFGRATVRSKIDEKRGVLWSFITSDDFEKTGRSTKDVSHVMDYLQKEAPRKSLTALLWQDPESKNVSVALAGDQKILEDVKTSAGGEFQSPHLLIEKRFKNFIEAEGYITSLLEGVL